MVKQKLYIVRGLPGAGKTTWCENRMKGKNAALWEADKFFESPTGDYKWNGHMLTYAHPWCYNSTIYSLYHGVEHVFVANTFVVFSQVEKYLDLLDKFKGLHCDLVTVRTQFQNIHGVTDGHLEAMKRKWEETPSHLNGFFDNRLKVKEVK